MENVQMLIIAILIVIFPLEGIFFEWSSSIFYPNLTGKMRYL